MIKRIKKIGVIGAGTMGRGIAQVFALYNFPVVLIDNKEAILRDALEKIKIHTAPDLYDKVAGLIETSSEVKKVEDCDLVIEAVFEHMDIKKEILKILSSVCQKNALIATNTSSFSIDELAKEVDDPSRFIGMHFMNPAKVMKLVEVIKGNKTSEETTNSVVDLAKKIEKIPAVVNDAPGFVSNRLLFSLIGEALWLLEKGIATKEDIDRVIKYGMNHPFGPIELADFIGLDVCLDIMSYLYENLGRDNYRPPPCLLSLVTEGKLGKKSGEGFYKYS